MSEKHTIERETRDGRYDCLFLAQVVDNVDPELLGRVKLFVPGLLEPSSLWAYPCGAMYGVKNGLFWVPEKETNGVVWLNQGDVDHPYFMAGPWGAPGGIPDVPEQAAGSPDKVVFRWRNFYMLVDGTTGSEKVIFEDLTTHAKFEVDRVTGNFTRTLPGPTGNESSTIKGNLSTIVQTGNEVHTLAAGGRTTSIALNDAKTVGGNETKTITGSRTETIDGSLTQTVVGASSEIVTLAKSITTAVAMALTAGLAVVVSAGGAFQVTASGISLDSSGPSATSSVGLQTNTFLGGILEVIVGAVARTITGTVIETVSGLWTMVVTGGLLIQGAVVQIGTGAPNGYQNLLNAMYHSTVFMAHTHVAPSGGGTTSTPPAPSPPTLAAAETADLTAS